MLVKCIVEYPEYFTLGRDYFIVKVLYRNDEDYIIIVDDQGEGWWPADLLTTYLNLDWSR